MIREHYTDPLFSKVSVHSLTNGGAAHDVARAPSAPRFVAVDGDASTAMAVSAGDGRCCIARFVHESECGWPMHRIGGSLGFRETAAIAVFATISDGIEALNNISPPPRVEDLVVPLGAVTWRALLYSHYDSSCYLAYRGRSYDLAATAFGVMCGVAATAEGSNYLKAVIEGVVVRSEAAIALPGGSRELPASVLADPGLLLHGVRP